MVTSLEYFLDNDFDEHENAKVEVQTFAQKPWGGYPAYGRGESVKYTLNHTKKGLSAGAVKSISAVFPWELHFHLAENGVDLYLPQLMEWNCTTKWNPTIGQFKALPIDFV